LLVIGFSSSPSTLMWGEEEKIVLLSIDLGLSPFKEYIFLLIEFLLVKKSLSP